MKARSGQPFQRRWRGRRLPEAQACVLMRLSSELKERSQAMNIYKGRWISVSTHDREGYSHIRIRDIHRIAVNKSITPDGDRYSVTLFSNGTEFVYSRGKTLGDAEVDAGMLLELSVKAGEGPASV
jgi:hypothetical protein